jgi:trehalose 6-phosphate phosphatase
VFFDFDGTLSDIVDDPDAARPAAGAAEALRKLAAHCPVAVLSGRDLADVTERVGLPGIWYAGSHGFELTAPDGTHHQNDAAAAAIPVLERVAARLRDQLGPVPGVVVEHKRFGVAVHYRNAARDRVGEVAAAVRAAGQRHALRVTTGREVIELRPDIDWDKGKTLRWVIDHLRHAGPQAGANLMPIYLGDDITDEDAFDAVRHDGIPIVVRHTDDGDRATAALFALDSPARVTEFTDRLARQLADAQVS